MSGGASCSSGCGGRAGGGGGCVDVLVGGGGCIGRRHGGDRTMVSLCGWVWKMVWVVLLVLLLLLQADSPTVSGFP